MRIKLLAVICFFTIVSLAQNKDWTVSSSAIKFKIKNAGFMVDGIFEGMEAKIHFDAAKSYSNSIEASVDAKTINTDSEGRDKHLKKEEYFSVDKFPKINLVASTFAKQADGSFKGYFKLTLKGVTKEVVIPFTFIEKENKALVSGSFKIDRRDYGVGESSLILSDNVTVTVELNLVKNL